jgi:hypothetical protein
LRDFYEDDEGTFKKKYEVKDANISVGIDREEGSHEDNPYAEGTSYYTDYYQKGNFEMYLSPHAARVKLEELRHHFEGTKVDFKDVLK